ncbi:hypothetical protein V6N13_142119 [Hibiscus sabdariffa]
MYGSDGYCMYLHTGGKFVRDLFARYEGGETYVEHKVYTPIIVDDILLLHGAEGSNEFRGDVLGDNATEGAGDIVGEGAGGEVASEIAGEAIHEGASEVLTEGVATDVVYEGVDEGVHEEDVDAAHAGVHEEAIDTVQEGAVKGVHEEAVDVVHEGVHEEVVDTVQEVANAIHEGTDGATKTMNEGVSVDLNDDDDGVAAATDELQSAAGQQNFYESESEDAYSEDGVYLMKVKYLSDGNDDDELQSSRTTFKSFEGKTVNRVKKHVETDSDSVSDETQLKIRKETMVEEENVVTTREVDGNETDYFDGKQFKEAIRKYSKTSRRELKIIKNEPNRVTVKCIASAHCPWRIHVITNRMTSTCIRAKNLVSSRLAGNVKEEFRNLWDYANELRAKHSGRNIKMVVNRVTGDSPPYFLRFYVCFDALKRGWKEDCRPIFGLDGCFLKGPFQGELLPDLGMEDGFGYTTISDQHKGTNVHDNSTNVRRSKSSNDPTPSSHKGKEKVNIVKPKPRRSTRLQGFGLHTNLDIGEQALYSGTSTRTIVSPTVQQSDARKKRKAVGEPLATQESVATKMKKK